MNRKWLVLALLPLAFIVLEVASMPSRNGWWRFDIANNQIVHQGTYWHYAVDHLLRNSQLAS